MQSSLTKLTPADIEWRNGQPYSRQFDDIYFSPQDGLAESEYVFIEGNDLLNDWCKKQQNNSQSKFSIVELGFGSGLNFLLTADKWLRQLNSTKQNQSQSAAPQNKPHLHYISIEKHPLLLGDLKRCCQLWSQFSSISSPLIAAYPPLTYGCHQLDFKSHQLSLTLLFMPVEEALPELKKQSDAEQLAAVDHWFLDGFAPSKNASMWGESIAKQIAALSKPGTRLATFSVAAAVKKPLEAAGFCISKRKGFGRKREMLTAQLAVTD